MHRCTHGIVFFLSLQRANKAKALRLLVNIYQPRATDTTAHHPAPRSPWPIHFSFSSILFHISSSLSFTRILTNNAGTTLRINTKHWAFDFGAGYQITDHRLPIGACLSGDNFHGLNGTRRHLKITKLSINSIGQKLVSYAKP